MKGEENKEKISKKKVKKDIKKAGKKVEVMVSCSWLFGFLISRVSLSFFDGFLSGVFWGFFSYLLSFPLFYRVTLKDFGDKTKILAKGLGFWFLVSGFVFWSRGFHLASLGYNKRSLLSFGFFVFPVLYLRLIFFSKLDF